MRDKVPRKHSNGTELRGRRAEGIFCDTTLPPGLAGRRSAADHFTEAKNMKRAWSAAQSVVRLVALGSIAVCSVAVAATTELMSRATDGTPGEGGDRDSTISSDGRYVAFRSARADRLPSGAMFEIDDEAYLAWQRLCYRWSPSGYVGAGLLQPLGKVKVLTPPSTVAVLEAGYRPWVHPSVLRP
jgi:hypothetical protein